MILIDLCIFSFLSMSPFCCVLLILSYIIWNNILLFIYWHSSYCLAFWGHVVVLGITVCILDKFSLRWIYIVLCHITYNNIFPLNYTTSHTVLWLLYISPHIHCKCYNAMLQSLILIVFWFLNKLREKNSILFYFHQYIFHF